MSKYDVSFDCKEHFSWDNEKLLEFCKKFYDKFRAYIEYESDLFGGVVYFLAERKNEDFIIAMNKALSYDKCSLHFKELTYEEFS